MSKERIEDLGRLSEKLSSLCDHEAFDWKKGVRCKDAADWFHELKENEQYEIINGLSYNLEEMCNSLHECYTIARWGDE